MITRRFLAAFAALPAAAQAQDAPFPNRPMAMLVGFSPGGGADILARLLAPRLSEDLGQPVAVENRTGASGTIAAAATSRARPDGYMVSMGTVSGNVVAPLAMRPQPIDPVRDLTPILLVATVPMVVTVPANSPARDLRGFIELLRAEPGRRNHASNGPGSSQHLAAELFQQATGTRMVHVPYRGSGQAMTDLIAGAVDVNFDTLSSVLPHIRQGTLRGLAVTTAQRSAWTPDLPTVAEAGVPGFDINVWYMLYGPPGLPDAITKRWASATNRALAPPEIRQRLRDGGFDPAGGTPADAAAFVRTEAARYADIIRRANLRIE